MVFTALYVIIFAMIFSNGWLVRIAHLSSIGALLIGVIANQIYDRAMAQYDVQTDSFNQDIKDSL